MDDTKIDYGIFMYKIVQKILRKLYIGYKHFDRVIFKAHIISDTGNKRKDKN